MKSIEQMVEQPQTIQLVGRAMGIFLQEIGSHLSTIKEIHPLLIQQVIPQIVDIYLSYILSLPTTVEDLNEMKQAFVNNELIKLLEAMPATATMQ